MGELSGWAKKQSKTLILDDGETVGVIYQGYKIVPNPFDIEKEIVVYQVEVEQDGNQVVKAFRSSSGKAARFFDEIKKGAKIRITRKGQGNDTKYEFAEVGGDKQIQGQQEETPF